MAQMIHDLVDPAVLIDYVRLWDNEVRRPNAQWTLDSYLPNRQIDDLEYRIRKGTLVDTDIAAYRSWDTPAKMTQREGTFMVEGSLGPVSRQIPLGEEEGLRARALLLKTNDPIIAAIFADAEKMIRSVQGRIEQARGDLIDDGTVTIAENGLVLSANFGRNAAMRKTAATVWTNTAANILSELLGWCENYTDFNGVPPDHILMPKTRVTSFALNTEMRNYAAANGTIPTRINRSTVDSIFAEEGLPPIRLYDSVVRVDGVSTRVLPVDKVYLMPSAAEPLGNTFYGPTAESLLLRERGLIEAEAVPGIVAVVVRNEHPVQTFTVGTAVALPAMPNPDLILDADVA